MTKAKILFQSIQVRVKQAEKKFLALKRINDNYEVSDIRSEQLAELEYL